MIAKSKPASAIRLALLLVVLSLLQLGNSYRIELRQLPVNQVLLNQVQFRLNRLLQYLSQQSSRIDKYELYARVRASEAYLEQMEQQTADKYRNLVQGTGNRVGGIKNIVIGQNNRLIGNKNWVFAADYSARHSHLLVVDKWMIELDLKDTITTSPCIAITQW